MWIAVFIGPRYMITQKPPLAEPCIHALLCDKWKMAVGHGKMGNSWGMTKAIN